MKAEGSKQRGNIKVRYERAGILQGETDELGRAENGRELLSVVRGD